MPDISHCQITRSTKFVRQVRIIKPNPNATTNPNLILTLTVTKEINKHLRTRLCETVHAQWSRCELFGTASYLILHRYHKVKPIWILLKQDRVGDNGRRWTIYKSASHSRQTTTSASHHSVFYRLDALSAAQPTVSNH